MPIEISTPITAISQDDYHAIDRIMTGHAFDIHNEFGRLLDEAVYKTELAHRCANDGMSVQRAVLIRVRHHQFIKDYFIDLLLCGSTIIEAKVVKALAEAHFGQGFNYLLLAGTHHGTLLNFRPPQVQKEFLSTQLTHPKRCRFETTKSHWPADEDYSRLHDVVQAFCSDVGLGLDLPLYREAFATLAGMPGRQLVPLFSKRQQIGHQEMHLLTAEIGLAVTALPETANYRAHLLRLLHLTNLQSIAWANLRLEYIQLTSLERQNQVG